MLTLDSEKLARQQQITKTREHRTRSLELVRENVARKERTIAPDGGLITTSLEAQWGHPMTSRQLFDRLVRLNPDLIYEVTLNNERLAGIYRIKDGQKVFVCGMERNFMPERSVRVPKVERVATETGFEEVQTFEKEIRGWRTVLARLVQERLITLAQVERAFPLSDGQSRNWQRATT